MSTQFLVAPGTIVLCDYDRGGFQPPEMVKRRPAVVVSPRLPHRDNLCTVIPLSGTPPAQPVPYQVAVTLLEALPEPYDRNDWWAKCDMLATVSFKRLDLFRTGRDQYGRRKYLHPRLSAAQFLAVRSGILHAIGLQSLTEHL